MSSITLANDNVGLPSTAQLLTMGGDRRIVCDPATGANKYHCQPAPDASLLAYGSATASTISQAAFASAEQLRQRLESLAHTQAPSVIYGRELERIRGDLRYLYGLSDTDIVFASSGTDLHLFAAQLAGESPLILMMEAAETGSGVPQALEGRHFSDTTVSGKKVVSGAAVDGACMPEVVAIASRNPDGGLRPIAEADSEFASLASAAAAAGRNVLLILTDVSKTGLIVPSLPCVLELHQRFPAQVEILVDACQFRLSPATLRAYLEQGFMVAVTGSKFISGPAFSGALFIPDGLSQKLRSRILPEAFGQYSVSADWPDGWKTQKILPDLANYGLLLRWQAALAEMQRFHALPERSVTQFLEHFATTIQARLENDPALQALPTPAPDRHALIKTKSWDNIPTIFPFLLLHADGTFLNRNEMDAVYKRLRKECGIEVGQPVLCGTRDNVPISALRLCLSARLIVDALSPGGKGSEAVVNDALSILDKAVEFTLT